MTSSRLVFRTRLCDLLGIDYPVLQSGMGLIAGPDLVAEVSGAGALGIVAGFMLGADPLRAAIRDVRARTNRPFGVNLWLSADLRPSGAPAKPSDEIVQKAQAALNPIRATLGLPPVTTSPSPPPDLVSGALQVVLDERVPVLSIAVGNPGSELVAECHRRGIKVIGMVTTVADGLTVEASGVDAVVAQGAEAGGHRAHLEKPPSPEVGAVGTLALVPQLVDALRIPVIAAGGIADGRGVIAALALGASGVLMGTRFVATRESMAFAAFKKALLEESGDATTITDVFTGRYARVLRNGFSESYGRSGAPVLPFPWHYLAAADIYRQAVAKDQRDSFPLVAGQSVG
ncbi:MAG: nitronate monooxygenase, partial [Acidobacteria bacterium]|nr:nitronate monooxygenase [Acidobacteriota bacterium]